MEGTQFHKCSELSGWFVARTHSLYIFQFGMFIYPVCTNIFLCFSSCFLAFYILSYDGVSSYWLVCPSPSASPTSALHPSTAPATTPHALRLPHNWGAVLDPPPPTSISGLVSSLAVVSLPPGGGEARNYSQHGNFTHGILVIILHDHTSHHSL